MHKRSSRIILLGLIYMTSACAGSPPVIEAPPQPPPQSIVVSESKVSPKVPPPAPAVITPSGIQVWRMKKGKLEGASQRPLAKLISKTKNKKGAGFTIDSCFDYGNFAIFESKSSDEMGSAEIYVRHKTPGAGPLCVEEYKGRQVNLRIREGSFAGVAGEYAVIEGADGSEGMLEAQIFNLESGNEIYRALHHPSEEFALTKKDGLTSLVYFAKVSVKCELVSEGKTCWDKVLTLNKLPRSTRMPDCKTPFEKTGTPVNELALVTAKARINNLEKPKLEFVGGRATCVPEP